MEKEDSDLLEHLVDQFADTLHKFGKDKVNDDIVDQLNQRLASLNMG